MRELPQKFTDRMAGLLGNELADFLDSYEQPPVRGIRANLLKTSPSELKGLLSCELEPSKTLEEGFVLRGEAEGLGSDPYHIAGLFYIQEPSAMAPIAAAEIQPGMRVLDLCAAPGGKSGGIAARLGGSGLLVANEIVPNRAKTLCFTLERLGVTNAAVTCAHPEAIAEALPGYFDRVIVDAPCSGEGMFRKDENAIAEWSEEHVISCAARQRAILCSAYKALRPGGKLIYSTCTFSREENEDNVEWLTREFPDMEAELMERLYPHRCAGEGHFAARLKKTGEGEEPQRGMKLFPCREKGYSSFLESTFILPPAGEPYILKDGRVLLIGNELPEGLSKLRVLSAGVHAGDMIKGRLEPSHSLFMAAHGGKYRGCISLMPNDAALAAFLRGNTIDASNELSGYLPVCVNGFPVGFGKAVGGTVKNHIPKGLRIM